MKIKYVFTLSEVAGETVAISAGNNQPSVFVALNSTAKFLWSHLAEGSDPEGLVAAMLEEYDGLDEETARADVDAFIQLLRDKRILDES